MKNLLTILEKHPNDSLQERLDKEPLTHRYWFMFSTSILLLLLCAIMSWIGFMVKVDKPAQTFSINPKQEQPEQLITLPYPHQSFKNITKWLELALMNTYSFDFNNYNERVDLASEYFTSDGYTMYKNALNNAKIQDFINKKIQVSLVTTREPVLINRGKFGTTEFLRFRAPVSISYFGGAKPIIQNQIVEILVLRVPAHQSPKGLAIAQYNMGGV